MTFRQALAKHRFIAALLLIGMAIYFFLLVMHIHAILTLNAPLSFTSFYLVFYLCFCCYIIVRMLQDKIMIYWFLASLFLFCFPCILHCLNIKKMVQRFLQTCRHVLRT